MSMWGFAGKASSKYFGALNTGAAKRLISTGFRGAGYRGAASGLKEWAMGGGTAGRIARMGTLGAGAGLVGSNFRKPSRFELQDGTVYRPGIGGPTNSQVKKMLDDRGIPYS